MQGFDDRFTSPPDYILGITEEIWEDRGVELLHDYYTPDIPVRSPDGFVVGNEAVIDATYATLEEFPDRQLLGEDVIWSDDGEGGFLSSHRIYSTATHTGAGAFGPATGTRLRYRVIADCAAHNNQIYDEWLVRDFGAIVRQLGTTPQSFAKQRLENLGTQSLTPLADQSTPPLVYTGRGNDDPRGHRYAENLRAMLIDPQPSVKEVYDRAVHAEVPGGFDLHGWDEVDTYWANLRACFSDVRLEIHHQIGREDEGLGERGALRWSLHGTHTGGTLFGDPSGAPVHIMGISHAEFGPWGLRREFVLFDEVAIWTQILQHASANANRS